MDFKGANPFLLTEDDYVSPNAGNSNPFLMGGDDFMDGNVGGNDNPFLSQTAASVAPSGGATNPFAFDPMDLGPQEAEPADFGFNSFVDPSLQAATNIFSEANMGNQNFFIDKTANIPSIVPQKPTDLDLKYTHTVDEYNGVNNGGPKRPPPPRPPPSKETQDLLMSVMGEMDAASSHLLDRIPLTRTPSPVSMRDLHSPSPTPDPTFGDLLDVSDAKTETQNQEDDFMSMTQDINCDINQNPPVDHSFMQPQQIFMQSQEPMMPEESFMQSQSPVMMQSPMMQTQQPSVMPMMQSHEPMIPQQPFMQSQPPLMQAQPPIMQPHESMVQQQPYMQPQHPQPFMQPHQAQPSMTQQQQEPVKPPNIPPARPGPPVRPPRPQPPQVPQKPPPPFAQPAPAQVNPTPQSMVRPPKPPPPSMQPPPISEAYDEMFDMFGCQQQAAPKTTADIMNLYKAKQDVPVDLLSTDTMEPAEAMESVSENNSRKSSIHNLESAGNNAEGPMEELAITPSQTQDNFLSPQTEMQMDTSDSQSKESVSSVTFNPFAAVEETSPTNPSVIPSQEFNNLEYTEENFEQPLQTDNSHDIFGTTKPTDDNYFQNEKVPSIFEVEKHDYDVYHPEAAPIFGTTDNSTFQNEPIPIFGTTVTKNVVDNFDTNTNNDAFGDTDNFQQDPIPIFGTTINTNVGSINNDAFGAVPDNKPYEQEVVPIFGTTPKVPNNFGAVTNNAFSSTPNKPQRPAPPPVPPFKKKIVADNFGTVTSDAFGQQPNKEPPPIFGTTIKTNTSDAFSSNPTDAFGTNTQTAEPPFGSSFGGFGGCGGDDQFDAFSAKFESAKDENKNGAFDAFSGGAVTGGGDTWGNDGFSNTSGFNDTVGGFGGEDTFDSFLAMREPPAVPQSTPNRMNRSGSLDSDEDKDFSVVIRPKGNDDGGFGGIMPVLAPPPVPTSIAFSDASRINPFDQSEMATPALSTQDFTLPLGEMTRTDSQETPPTPLFDDDVSQPLEPFPRIDFAGEGWEMQLRQPNKKKITGQRFWKKIFVRIVHQQDCVLLQLFNTQQDKDPFQELPLQPCYSVSDISAQQYDNFGKIFTLKLQYIFYKERPGVRPGQVKKAERITNKLSQFAAYAIQGDYQGCKEFGSDLKKLGLPVEHAPQVSQLMKLGSLNFEDLKTFSVCIEEALFTLQAHRDRALHYKMEEVQVTAVDELYVEQDSEGHIEKQIARVRLFFLGFLTGMPDIELGVNDMRRQGKEVVGRHDIIPVVTEEWIRLENVEFHSCVQQVEYNDTHIIKFKPPDACYIELLRFRIRPPKNRELPLQLKAQIVMTGHKIELRADVLVPGFASRKLGQVPCEDVMIRFPIPECWIYMFRVEKHFRYGSVKSAHRRTGKIKGIERILGTVDTLQESLIEVTSGQAKYEHQHRAIVWRCPRLPKEGQGAYTTHNMVCRLSLTSYDQMPESLAEYAYVEFTMPATQASHTTVRSVSLQNSDSDEPPEKYVRYLARHEYRVGIEHTEGDGPNAYAVAARVKPTAPAPIPEEKPKPIPEAESSTDSE